MGLFRFWKGPDINQGLKQFEETPGAVLLDVRSRANTGRGACRAAKTCPCRPLTALGSWPQARARRCLFIATAAPRSRQAACG